LINSIGCFRYCYHRYCLSRILRYFAHEFIEKAISVISFYLPFLVHIRQTLIMRSLVKKLLSKKVWKMISFLLHETEISKIFLLHNSPQMTSWVTSTLAPKKLIIKVIDLFHSIFVKKLLKKNYYKKSLKMNVFFSLYIKHFLL